MNASSSRLVFAAIVGVVLLAVALVVRPLVTPAAAAESAPPHGADLPPRADDVELRYAQSALRLAETNLQRAVNTNQRVANVVPADQLAEYRQDVEVAKLRVEQLNAGTADEFAVWQRRAVAQQQAAELDYKNAQAVNQRAGGTYADLDIERYRLRVEVAQLAVERGKQLASRPTSEQVNWQLDLLQREIDQIKENQLRRPNWQPVYRY